MPRRIFITVAEVSGDLHASHLIHSLLRADPTLKIEGHGGPKMRAAGAIIHHETTANAAMGVGALGRVREMHALLKKTRAMFRADPPDLQICVDSPALNFHFAKIAKTAPARPVPVLSYVAPQLWAWREGRMKKLRKWVDHLACILPFEEAYFRAHGVNATFVGHPLFDELRPNPLDLDERAARRAELGLIPQTPYANHLAPDNAVDAGSHDNTAPADPGTSAALAAPNELAAPIIGLLAGSRRSEAARNFPRMLEVAAQIRKAFPGARFLIPTTPATDPVVRQAIAALSPSSILHAPAICLVQKQDAFDTFVPLCDLVITVSGTATLHVAIHGTPMLIVYHGSPVVWNLLGRWIVKTRTYGLVNLLAANPALASSGRVTSEMHVAPEFIPWYGSIMPTAEYAIDLLRHPEKLDAQRKALGELVKRLESPGASDRTAGIAMSLLKNSLRD